VILIDMVDLLSDGRSHDDGVHVVAVLVIPGVAGGFDGLDGGVIGFRLVDIGVCNRSAACEEDECENRERGFDSVHNRK
jgi:hypothetical protein